MHSFSQWKYNRLRIGNSFSEATHWARITVLVLFLAAAKVFATSLKKCRSCTGSALFQEKQLQPNRQPDGRRPFPRLPDHLRLVAEIDGSSPSASSRVGPSAPEPPRRRSLRRRRRQVACEAVPLRMVARTPALSLSPLQPGQCKLLSTEVQVRRWRRPRLSSAFFSGRTAAAGIHGAREGMGAGKMTGSVREREPVRSSHIDAV